MMRMTTRRGSTTPCASSSADAGALAVEPLLVIIECDGVLCDVHTDGHRVAFNEAFADLGMAGAAWHPERQGLLYIPFSFKLSQRGMPRRCSS